MNKSRVLWVVVLLLLGQLLIRAHNITELPGFVDENNHIVRSAALRALDQHPAQESHGKFLFYFLLATFDLSERDTALHLARTTVALSSLLTSALIFGVVRYLTRRREPALLALLFYAAVPYAFFYERMALADPFAGTLGILTLWLSIRLARQPSYTRAVMVGIAAAATVAAKLTMSFAVGFPILAFLFFAPYESLWDAIQRYMPFLVVSGVTFIILWLPVLIPARLSFVDENATDFILVNTELVDDATTPDSLSTKLTETWTKLTTMTHVIFAVVAILGLSLLAISGQGRQGGFLLACLALAWLPSILIVQNLQTRYLMSGIPILAILMGVGMAVDMRDSQRYSMPIWSAAIGLWVLLFSLPFAHTLITTPPETDMPPLDAQNYFWDRYNNYGNREALVFLQAEGIRNDAGQVVVFPLTKVCLLIDLDGQPDMDIRCMDGFFLESMAEIAWQTPLSNALDSNPVVYVLTSEQTDTPPPGDFIWTQVAEFAKPRDIQRVTVWEVRR